MQLARGDLHQLIRRLVTCPGWCRLQFRHVASLLPVTYSGVFHGVVHKVSIWVLWCVAEPGWAWWKIQPRRAEPQIYTNRIPYTMHFKRYDSAMDFGGQCTSIMPVLQLPQSCSLQHTGGKCWYTTALGTWLYISVPVKFLFSCLSFLVLLHRTQFQFLGVGDTASQSPGGSVTPSLHTPLLSFRVICHNGVTGPLQKHPAFKPVLGTHRIVLHLSQCPFLGQLQQQRLLKSLCHNQSDYLSHHRPSTINMCMWLESLKFRMSFEKITLHLSDKANGETGKTSRRTFRKW